MAKFYWLSISKIKKDDYFKDYLINPNKRFQTGPGSGLGQEYWNTYGIAYRSAKDSGELLLRAKIVNKNNCLKIYQIWDSKEARKKFENAVNPEFFLNVVKMPIKTYQYNINELQKNHLLTLITNSKKVIIQVLREDHRQPGLIIGDPLKKDPLIFT